MAKESKNTDRMKALLNSVTEDMINGGVAQHFDDGAVKVERIILDLIRPDPIQPRRVLPDQVHFAFHEGRMTPAQALREMVRVAQVAARQRGRPFGHVLELLPNDEREDDDYEVALSPAEQILRDLVNLAVTIRDDGQVNPLTVVDATQGVTRQYRIETGERRYWATWLLRDFIPEYSGDGMIPCIVVPAEQSSAFRQARENTARSGLSAIAMARQAALLLLTIHGYDLPVTAVSNDFYRQALDLTLRGKREYTEAVLTAMGGISTSLFSRYKALLQLSDEAIDIADRYDVEEGILRHVIKLPVEDHGEMLQQIVQFSLTARQVRELCSEDAMDKNTDHETISKEARQFAKLLKELSNYSSDTLAKMLLDQEGDPVLARARLRSWIKLIEETEKYLTE